MTMFDMSTPDVDKKLQEIVLIYKIQLLISR